VPADGVLTEAHGVDLLEDLDGRVPRVGHVGVDGGRTAFGRARAHPSRDGFVIGKGGAEVTRIFAAQRQIVHGALAGGWNSLRRGLGERPQQRVYHALRGFHVAARNRGGRARIHDGSRWSGDMDWGHQTRSRGDILG